MNSHLELGKVTENFSDPTEKSIVITKSRLTFENVISSLTSIVSLVLNISVKD